MGDFESRVTVAPPDRRSARARTTVEVVTGRDPSGTLGTALGLRRRQAFVGRASETELFAAALQGDGPPPFSVLYVHGPGGIGKSTLLESFATLAAAKGANVVQLDGRSLVPTRSGLLEAWPDDADPPGVLLIDAYERLAPLDGWIRTTLLPQLPRSTLTVVAARTPPSPDWRSDPAWRDLLRIVSLRNLSPQDCRAYLTLSEVDGAKHDTLVEVTRGHPLALSLLTDLVLRGGDVEPDPLTPDLVGTLVRRFVDAVPSARHRRALEVCALARVTTEALLRDTLALDNAGELFDWLRALSFIESAPDGLLPHDLARDVLDIDLRWRDPAAYEHVFRSVRAHIHRRLASLTGIDQQRAIFDEKFVFRNLPSVLSPVEWDAWGERYPEPARSGDRDVILALVEAAEGAESAAIAGQWWELQPEGFFVVRGDDGDVRGVLGMVTLTDGPGELGFDPGASAAWDYAQRMSPARAGDVVTQTRFVIDRDRYQAPSPTLNTTPILAIQRYLQTPRLAWDFLTLAEPDPFNDYFAIADLPRAAGADFVIGDRTYGLFAHDFRRVPVDAWLELVTERALLQDPTPRPQRAEPVALSQPAFADAVRHGLRDLQQPELLARNPLRQTGLVAARAAGDIPEGAALAHLIREAVESLRAHPRDDKRWRAMDRTYLRPAASQERAAELLGLPFSTYRRHLTEGVARVVAYLWDMEIYGTGRGAQD